MESESARRRWRFLRDDLDRTALDRKDSTRAILELSNAYDRLTDTERVEVNGLLAEWALSDDERLRYDAVFIVNEKSIREALPALRILQERLEHESPEPGAPYEWAKVNRVVAKVTAG